MACSGFWRETPLLAPITLKTITDKLLAREFCDTERERESLLNEKVVEVGERVRHF